MNFYFFFLFYCMMDSWIVNILENGVTELSSISDLWVLCPEFCQARLISTIEILQLEKHNKTISSPICNLIIMCQGRGVVGVWMSFIPVIVIWYFLCLKRLENAAWNDETFILLYIFLSHFSLVEFPSGPMLSSQL